MHQSKEIKEIRCANTTGVGGKRNTTQNLGEVRESGKKTGMNKLIKMTRSLLMGGGVRNGGYVGKKLGGKKAQ